MQIHHGTNREVVLFDRTQGFSQIPPSVIFNVDHGIGRFFDLERARFIGVSRSGTEMLVRTLTAGHEAMKTQVASYYGISASEVEKDSKHLYETLEKKGVWLHRTAHPSPKPGLIHSILVKMMRMLLLRQVHHFQAGRISFERLLLALAWFSYRLFGWQRTLELWFGAASNGQACNFCREDTVQQIDATIRQASSTFCLPVNCKERALVAAFLLGCRGIESNLILGLQFHPFQAHAWVEAGNILLTDDPQYCCLFTPVATYSNQTRQG